MDGAAEGGGTQHPPGLVQGQGAALCPILLCPSSPPPDALGGLLGQTLWAAGAGGSGGEKLIFSRQPTASAFAPMRHRLRFPESALGGMAGAGDPEAAEGCAAAALAAPARSERLCAWGPTDPKERCSCRGPARPSSLCPVAK